MNDCYVSVIVPIYNGAQFLRPCVDSVLGQSLLEVELILVNDASTDDTQDIIDEYINRDGRVSTVRLVENMGLPAARNAGLERAVGKYIIFMDADDYWMDKEMLTTLYAAAVDYKIDLIDFGFIRSDADDEKRSGLKSKKHIIDMIHDNNWVIQYNAWAKMIDHAFLKDKNIKFDPSIALGEDALFSVELYCNASRLLVTEADYYCYRINEGGITRSAWNKKKLHGTVNWLVKAIPLILKSDAYSRKPIILQAVLCERIGMLYRVLGSQSLKVFNEDELRVFVDQWSGCMQYLDLDYINRMFVSAQLELYLELLHIVMDRNYPAYRSFFSADIYNKNINEPTTITILQQQAAQLGQDLLQQNKAHIRCDFGGGVIITLPIREAHQLGRQLITNQKPQITLRFG